MNHSTPPPAQPPMDPMEHLDALALDAARAGEASPEALAHLEQCERCRGEVESLQKFAARVRGPDLDVPETIDTLILARARERRPRRWVPLAAAAAVLVGAVYVLIPRGEFRTAPHIDIVDAYRLAVLLEEGGEIDVRWDMNRDGTVDIEDVHHLARLSVKLERAG